MSLQLSEPAQTSYSERGSMRTRDFFGFSGDDGRLFFVYPPTRPGGDLRAEIFEVETGERAAEFTQPDVVYLGENISRGMEYGFLGAASPKWPDPVLESRQPAS